MILVDGVIKPFPNNSSTLHNETNNNSGGIYITCKKCGKKMQLTKNYKNNVFCRCSCGEIVKFGVSKYGMWCICENGNFPKVYEI